MGLAVDVGNMEAPAQAAGKSEAPGVRGVSGEQTARPAACAKSPDTPCVGECGKRRCVVDGLCIDMVVICMTDVVPKCGGLNAGDKRKAVAAGGNGEAPLGTVGMAARRLLCPWT